MWSPVLVQDDQNRSTSFILIYSKGHLLRHGCELVTEHAREHGKVLLLGRLACFPGVPHMRHTLLDTLLLEQWFPLRLHAHRPLNTLGMCLVTNDPLLAKENVSSHLHRSRDQERPGIAARHYVVPGS